MKMHIITVVLCYIAGRQVADRDSKPDRESPYHAVPRQTWYPDAAIGQLMFYVGLD